MNLAAAEKSLVADNNAGKPGRGDGDLKKLEQEFEQRKQTFDDEAKSIIEVKSSNSRVEDFRRLKRVFKAWKKDYKVRLREAKAKIHVSGVGGDADRHKRKWWGKKTKKSSM